jgi:hypothetical protein
MVNPKARALAHLRALGDIPGALALLNDLPVADLADIYLELYGEPTRSRNRDYLRKRLAFRVQELHEGGLSAAACELIARLGETLPERWRIRLRQPTEPDAPPPEAEPVVLRPTEPRDPRIPPPGTWIQRAHGGREHRVFVRHDGFEYEGVNFKTLTAVARHITGTAWNGFTFFGLSKPHAASTPARAA